jgi:hypothetical protein
VALRRADAVIARRAVEIREHEDVLRDLLAEYFRARESADAARADGEAAVARLRRDVEARIARVQEQAGREADGFEQEANAAVRRMLELGESRHAVADATGMSLAQVREAQRRAPTPADQTSPEM